MTGIFSPVLDPRDPRARGSIGAGVVLELGAWAEAHFVPGPRRRRQVRELSGAPLPITTEVVRRVAADRPGSISVVIRHELPVGQGFGMSAAGALAAGLAVARLLGRPARVAVETAHLAELFGGGGLGGVAAIQGGGLEVRTRAGIEPFGRVRHRPLSGPVYLAVTGPSLPSPRLLGDPHLLEKVRRAARAGIPRLSGTLGPARFMEAAERFGDRLDLPPASVNRKIQRLRSHQVRVARAMFGQSLFALPASDAEARRLEEGLLAEKLPALRLRAAAQGPFARVGPWPPANPGTTASLLSRRRPRAAP
ncbi:MAG: GHMP family kinase ATP-binding protein [Thermoplasmata archaeon]